MWVQIPPGAKFFRCRYKKIHLFPAKYRPYAFLLWADRRNVVAISPARTVWVQIPPCAKFFRRWCKKIQFFRPNIDHMRFCYALIRVMCLHLRPSEQCGFIKSHQVPTFSGLGIRKYTFFRPTIDRMPFLYGMVFVWHMVVTLWWVQIPPGANFFRRRYKKIHLFPTKYRPYAFLLCADTRYVVPPSPA